MASKQYNLRKPDPTVFSACVLALLVGNVLVGLVGLAKHEAQTGLMLQLVLDGTIVLLFTLHSATAYLFARLRPAKLVPTARPQQANSVQQPLAAA